MEKKKEIWLDFGGCWGRRNKCKQCDVVLGVCGWCLW